MKFSVPIRTFIIPVLLLLVLPLYAADFHSTGSPSVAVASGPGAALNIPPARARMSPELALQVHDARIKRQFRELREYRDETIIAAELPEMSRKGRYQLLRIFSAPKSLAFKAVDFVGDGFVKTNVIARLLQSEVDQAKKEDNSAIAITSENYKFSYKGVSDFDGADPVHVFQVKPRKKRVGLFKGAVYLDVYTGAMRRAEGKMVKSPSFFVKDIQFTQDYVSVGDFNLVSHTRSTAKARIVGKTILEITHSNLQVRSIYDLAPAEPASQAMPAFRTVSLGAPSNP